MIFEFKEYDGINRTPAIALLTRGHHELLDRGLAPPETVINWDDLAIVAFAGEVPVGVISYSHEKWRRILWIRMGYVAPEARRQGIYGLMWQRVVKAALNGFPNHCYREDALKKINGERPKEEVKETRDAPVPA